MLLADALASPSSGSDRDLKAARTELETAIQIDPTSSDAHQMLSDVFAWLGDKDRQKAESDAAARLRGMKENN
jgi:Tfp pilus assembly protein PilF